MKIMRCGMSYVSPIRVFQKKTCGRRSFIYGFFFVLKLTMIMYVFVYLIQVIKMKILRKQNEGNKKVILNKHVGSVLITCFRSFNKC